MTDYSQMSDSEILDRLAAHRPPTIYDARKLQGLQSQEQSGQLDVQGSSMLEGQERRFGIQPSELQTTARQAVEDDFYKEHGPESESYKNVMMPPAVAQEPSAPVRTEKVGGITYITNKPKVEVKGESVEDVNAETDYSKMSNDQLIRAAYPHLSGVKLGKKTAYVRGGDASDALAAAQREMNASGNGDVDFYSNLRSKEWGDREHAKWVAGGKKGKPVASGDTSGHNPLNGVALDIRNYEKAGPYLRKHGWVNDIPNDIDHFHYVGKPKGATTSMFAPAEAQAAEPDDKIYEGTQGKYRIDDEGEEIPIVTSKKPDYSKMSNDELLELAKRAGIKTKAAPKEKEEYPNYIEFSSKEEADKYSVEAKKREEAFKNQYATFKNIDGERVPFFGGAHPGYLEPAYDYKFLKQIESKAMPKMTGPYADVFKENADKNFVQRLFRPDAYPSLPAEGDKHKTHMMASSDDIAYPTIIQSPDTGKLRELGGRDAYDYAMKTGEFIKFKTNKEAEDFANNGYKKAFPEGWFAGKAKSAKATKPDYSTMSDDQLRELAKAQGIKLEEKGAFAQQAENLKNLLISTAAGAFKGQAGILKGLADITGSMLRKPGEEYPETREGFGGVQEPAEPTGAKPLPISPMIEGLQKYFGESAEQSQQLAEKLSSKKTGPYKDEAISTWAAETVGSLPAGILEFYAGVPWAALRGYAQSGWEGAASGAFERIVLGKIFDTLGDYSRTIRASGMAAAFFGQAKVHGESTPEALKAGATGLALGITSPQAKLSNEDIRIALEQPGAADAVARGLGELGIPEGEAQTVVNHLGSTFSPLLAEELKKAKETLALPPGQGFELVPERAPEPAPVIEEPLQPVSKSAKESAEIFEEDFRKAQSPVGGELLKEGLAHEEALKEGRIPQGVEEGKERVAEVGAQIKPRPTIIPEAVPEPVAEKHVETPETRPAPEATVRPFEPEVAAEPAETPTEAPVPEEAAKPDLSQFDKKKPTPERVTWTDTKGVAHEGVKTGTLRNGRITQVQDDAGKTYAVPSGKLKGVEAVKSPAEIATGGPEGTISEKTIESTGEGVVTDPARVQEIRNSIAEGEMILKSGKTTAGRKMSEAELANVKRSVDSAKAKIGETDLKPAEPGKATATEVRTAALDRLGNVRDEKPRPLNKMFGKNPTPEQIEQHRQLMRDWMKKYRKATDEFKKADLAEAGGGEATAKPDEIIQVRGGGPSTAEVVRFVKRSSFGRTLSEIWDGIKKGVAPTTRSEMAARTGRAISEAESRMNRERDIFVRSMKMANRQVFMKMDKEAATDFMQKMDTGKEQPSQVLGDLADTIDKMFQERVKKVQALGTGALEHVRGNYFPHIWKNVKAITAQIEAMLSSRRPYEGGRAFTQHRVFDDVQTGLDLGYEPVSWNPLDLVAIKLHEMDKYIMAHTSLQHMAEDIPDNVKIWPAGEKPPAGVTKINDRYSTFKRDGKSYIYVGTEDVAQVINNYLSPSLYQNKYIGRLFDVYMKAGHTLNMFQLGLGSMFHGGFTTLLATSTQLGVGVRALVEGRPEDAFKYFSTAPAAAVKASKLGDKMLGNWLNPEMHPEMAWLNEAVHKGGGQAGMEREMRTSHVKRMYEDWHRGIGGKTKAALRSPAALAEASMMPILNWYVPRLKYGVFGMMYQDFVARHPEASMETLDKEARQIWNRVDGRLGQVIYNRTFMNNWVKNAAQALMRAPGWKGGTVVEYGGAVKDTFADIGKVLNGEKVKITDRMYMAVGDALLHAVLNGALTYACTGEAPKDVMDFMAFRTGKKDKYGNPIRFLSPTYWKDLYAYANKGWDALLASTNPVLNLGLELWRNKSYYGVRIHAVADRWYEQLPEKLEDMGKHIAKQFEPFWLQGEQKVAEESGSAVEKGLPLVGFMPAPSRYTMTESQKYLSGKVSERMGDKARTQEEADKSKLKGDLLTLKRNENQKAFDEGLKQAVAEKRLTRKDAKLLEKESKKDPALHFFEHASIEEAIGAWSRATDEEKKAWLTPRKDKSGEETTSYMENKMMNAMKNDPDKWEKTRANLPPDLQKMEAQIRKTNPTLIKHEALEMGSSGDLKGMHRRLLNAQREGIITSGDRKTTETKAKRAWRENKDNRQELSAFERR